MVIATRHASGVAWVALLLCLAACVPLGTPVVSEGSPTQAITGEVFLVRKGDTLYSIAWRAGKDYKQLAQINGIAAPFVIYPGQRLRLVAPPETKAVPANPAAAPNRSAQISDAEVKSPARGPELPRPKAEVRTPPKAKAQAKSRVGVAKPVPKKPATSSKRAALAWVRPIKQNPSVNFGNGSKGWDYQVNGRTRLRTASGGQVVYAGNGIAGYERLVIVKHSGNLLSAYSFNGRILVSEQQKVRTGESLAELVPRNGGRQKVHFELRRDGRPINPKSLIKPS
tara:strand:- start:2177 stop:3025 length:849 start_codon:yes stop_codon:yes gene_type:complete